MAKLCPNCGNAELNFIGEVYENFNEYHCPYCSYVEIVNKLDTTSTLKYIVVEVDHKNKTVTLTKLEK